VSEAQPGSRSRRVHWDERYRTVGPGQVSWYEAEPRLSLALVDLAGTSPDAAVIDVGGGASGLSGELLARGFDDLTVLDVSEEALAAARRRRADPAAIHWIRADLLDWTPTRRWDVWHDRAVFHFLTEPDQRERYRALLHDALAPEGVVLLATFAADGPTTCSGLPVRRYTNDGLLRELGPTYTEVARGRYLHATPSGGDQPLSWVVARGPGVA